MLVACDLCHSRKVRCNRQDPCERCVESLSHCVRTRSTRKPRAKRPRWPAHATPISQHIPDLQATDDNPSEDIFNAAESSAQSGLQNYESDTNFQFEQWPNIDGHPGEYSWADVIDYVGLVTERHHNDVIAANEGVAPIVFANVAPHITSTAPISNPIPEVVGVAALLEAKIYIEAELSTTAAMSTEQRRVLQCALSECSPASTCRAQVSDAEENFSTEIDLYAPNMYPSEDAMCLLLAGSQTTAASLHSEVASIISPGTFERMATALRHKSVHGQTLVQHIVLVNFYALTFAVGLEIAHQTSSTQDHIRNLQQRYRHNAINALQRVSVLDTPSLTLLQTLLAGAMIFQMAGDVDKCSRLTAACCSTCAQLGGQYFARLASSASLEESYEVRHSLGHCYILDKALSMSLHRRSFLPEMEVNTSLLLPPTIDMLSAPILNVYLEFAKVQDTLCRRPRIDPAQGGESDTEQARALQQRMRNIREKIRKFRVHESHSTDVLLQGEWLGIDFVYYMLSAAIIRIHPRYSTDKYIQEDCREHARQSLIKLRDMQRQGLVSQRCRTAYCHSFNWIILLYPLTPFFMLFCNAVRYPGCGDIQLLQDVTTGLSMFAEVNESVRSIQQLCSALVSLCCGS